MPKDVFARTQEGLSRRKAVTVLFQGKGGEGVSMSP